MQKSGGDQENHLDIFASYSCRLHPLNLEDVRFLRKLSITPKEPFFRQLSSGDGDHSFRREFKNHLTILGKYSPRLEEAKMTSSGKSALGAGGAEESFPVLREPPQSASGPGREQTR